MPVASTSTSLISKPIQLLDSSLKWINYANGQYPFLTLTYSTVNEFSTFKRHPDYANGLLCKPHDLLFTTVIFSLHFRFIWFRVIQMSMQFFLILICNQNSPFSLWFIWIQRINGMSSEVHEQILEAQSFLAFSSYNLYENLFELFNPCFRFIMLTMPSENGHGLTLLDALTKTYCECYRNKE